MHVGVHGVQFVRPVQRHIGEMFAFLIFDCGQVHDVGPSVFSLVDIYQLLPGLKLASSANTPCPGT